MATESNPIVISSTYQQVEHNAEDIVKIQDELSHIITKINIDPSSGLRIINEKLTVYGMKVDEDLTQASRNKSPSEYTIGNVLEVKSISTVGLSASQGFNELYCLVQTQSWTSEESGAKKFHAQQIAFNSGLLMYGRKSVNDTTWDVWTPVSAKGKAQFIESLTQPTDQSQGEYWAFPIQSTVIDSPVNTRFNDHMKNQNNPHATTAAQIGAVDVTLGNLPDSVLMAKLIYNRVYLNLNATILANAWVGTAAPYTQIVSCDGIHIEDEGFRYGLVQSSDITQAKKELEAFEYLSLADAMNGSIKFTCYDVKPLVNMNIKVVR